MKLNNLVTILLALSLLASTACGNSSSSDDTNNADDTTPDVTEPEGYPYPSEKLGGSFTVLNYEQVWGCNNVLDYENESGEILNDAKYKRNRLVEEKLGITFEENSMSYPGWGKISQIIDTVINSTMADDGEFDAAILPLSFKPAVMLDNCLADLNTFGKIDLSNEWWDTSINESLIIDNRLYVASSPFNLFTLDMSWVLLFNENMMDDRGLDYPYQLVLDGEWTIDKLGEYVKSAVNLNGADSFTWTEGSPVIYGIGGHNGAPSVMVNAADVSYLKRDGNDFKIELTSERFVSAVEKLSALLNDKNGNVWWGNGDLSESGSYISLFNGDQSMFITCELKTTSYFRNMKSSYGLLPMPKFDSSQENYHTQLSTACGYICVPVTVADTDRVGLILDALSYESYKSVVPVYYDISMSQKSLRNDESVEMLNIIRETRTADFGDVLGITTAYATAVSTEIQNGGGNIASIAAENQNKVDENLKNTLKAFE